MSVTSAQLAAQPEMLRSKLFWISLPYFSEGVRDIETRFDSLGAVSFYIPFSSSGGLLAERGWLSRLCANYVGRRIDYTFPALLLRERLHACSIYARSRFFDPAPFAVEYAK